MNIIKVIIHRYEQSSFRPGHLAVYSSLGESKETMKRDYWNMEHEASSCVLCQICVCTEKLIP